jgi:transcriptional regulator with XRE-family HTH domain
MEYPDFALLIKKYRSFRKKTVYEVAEFVDVSPTYISQIENGKKLPSKKVLFPLVRFLGLKNDKGYWKKVENVEFDGLDLLEVYAEYKKINSKELFHEYFNYVSDEIKTNFIELQDLERRKNNKFSVNKKNGDIEPTKKPYFDLEWLLTQDQYHVFYGRNYNIQKINKDNVSLSEFSLYNILNDIDIKIIKGLIDAYISNKYMELTEENHKNHFSKE